MLSDTDFQTAISLARHYKAIGQTRIYLSKDGDGGKPWHLATNCEPGGWKHQCVSLLRTSKRMWRTGYGWLPAVE